MKSNSKQQNSNSLSNGNNRIKVHLSNSFGLALAAVMVSISLICCNQPKQDYFNCLLQAEKGERCINATDYFSKITFKAGPNKPTAEIELDRKYYAKFDADYTRIYKEINKLFRFNKHGYQLKFDKNGKETIAGFSKYRNNGEFYFKGKKVTGAYSRIENNLRTKQIHIEIYFKDVLSESFYSDRLDQYYPKPYYSEKKYPLNSKRWRYPSEEIRSVTEYINGTKSFNFNAQFFEGNQFDANYYIDLIQKHTDFNYENIDFRYMPKLQPNFLFPGNTYKGFQIFKDQKPILNSKLIFTLKEGVPISATLNYFDEAIVYNEKFDVYHKQPDSIDQNIYKHKLSKGLQNVSPFVKYKTDTYFLINRDVLKSYNLNFSKDIQYLAIYNEANKTNFNTLEKLNCDFGNGQELVKLFNSAYKNNKAYAVIKYLKGFPARSTFVQQTSKQGYYPENDTLAFKTRKFVNPDNEYLKLFDLVRSEKTGLILIEASLENAAVFCGESSREDTIYFKTKVKDEVLSLLGLARHLNTTNAISKDIKESIRFTYKNKIVADCNLSYKEEKNRIQIRGQFYDVENKGQFFDKMKAYKPKPHQNKKFFPHPAISKVNGKQVTFSANLSLLYSAEEICSIVLQSLDEKIIYDSLKISEDIKFDYTGTHHGKITKMEFYKNNNLIDNKLVEIKSRFYERGYFVTLFEGTEYEKGAWLREIYTSAEFKNNVAQN